MVYIRGIPLSAVNCARNTTASTVDFDGPDSVTEAVVCAVADAEDASPLELRPLAEVIDTDALDELVRGDGEVSVEFAYHGYRVSVSGAGRITVND